MVGYTITSPTPLSTMVPTTSQRACNSAPRTPPPAARAVTSQRSSRPYASDKAVSQRSMERSNQCGLGLCLSSSEHIMGDNVSATNPDTSTAPASASANSTNRRPVRPGVKASGAYTATNVRVMATMAKPISRAPLMAAENGSSPSSMWR